MKDDAISRQAVIDSLHSKFVDGFDSDRWWNSMSVLYAINKVPSVSTEKTGRWITWKEAGNEIPSETRFECSVCHDAAQTLCNGLDLLSPYCPNCGAKMEVEE